MSVLDFTDEKLNLEETNIATFWLIVTGLSATGLAWLQNLARTTGNPELAAAANSFLILFFISIITETFIFIFYRHRFWGDRTSGSSLGISFFMFYLFGGAWLLLTGMDVFSVLGPNTLLSQAAETGSLTMFQEVFFNVFMAPTIEENFFRLALPVLLFLAVKGFFESFEIGFLDNTLLEFVIAVLGSAAAFAAFHTGQIGNTSFTVQAFIFATLLSFIFLADLFFNVFEFITVVPAALVGVHMANNAAFYGIGTVINVLLGNTFGIVILVVMGMGLLAAIRTGLNIIQGG